MNNTGAKVEVEKRPVMGFNLPAMITSDFESNRRSFLRILAAAGAGVTLGNPLLARAQTSDKVPLGMDNFAVRAMGWKADALIDYAASLKLDVLFITDLDAFENFEESYLQGLRAKAEGQSLRLFLGSWSICPTSKAFRNKWGSAEEHLALGIRMAKSLGSPVFRVVLGTMEDRRTPGGIEARIEDTVKVLKNGRSQAIDAGVKIAIENHAGDMQSWELVQLIEAAGKEYVGANLDMGNATWTLEDPLVNLEKLGPYALSTSMRDSAIWESPKGITVAWTAMGEGDLDLKTYFKRFVEICPSVPVIIETISGFNREFPCLEPGFWEAFPKARASEFARYLVLAKRGKPRDAWKPASGQDRKLAEQAYQKAELERSLAFCKGELGFGIKRS
jgi:3-oxoisoapionate decarboxylase